MIDKFINLFFNKHPLVKTILIILINMLFFYRFMNLTSNLEYIIVITTAICINSFYIVSLFMTFDRKNSYPNYEEVMSIVIDDMDYAIPHKEEIFFEERVVEDKPLESTIEPTNEIDYDQQKLIEILRPKEVIHKEPIYDSKIDKHEYLNELLQYMSDNGISVDKNSIREIFASMAASKLIVFTNENPMLSERFIELFTDFIGANLFIDEINDTQITYEKLCSSEYSFDECIKNARTEINRLNIMTFKQEDLRNLHQYFSEVIDFSLNPLLPSESRDANQNASNYLPNNSWFMIIPNQFELSHISKQLAQSAVMIDLSAKPIKPKNTVYQNAKKLSYEHLNNFFIKGYEEHFLKEDDWKKIDQIEHYLNQQSFFLLENRVFRQLERYASTFLMFEGDEKVVIDSLLFSKVLPLIYTTEINSNKEQNDDISILFEKLFGLEYLSKAKVLLKKIQAVN